MRALLLAVFGIAAMRLASIVFWCLVALLCLRGKTPPRLRRRGCCSAACSACLDYLSSLSPCGNVLVVFFIIFPPVFVRMHICMHAFYHHSPARGASCPR